MVILKFVIFIFVSICFTEGIIPASFASTIIPIVPIIVRPSCCANFSPFQIINNKQTILQFYCQRYCTCFSFIDACFNNSLVIFIGGLF